MSLTAPPLPHASVPGRPQAGFAALSPLVHAVVAVGLLLLMVAWLRFLGRPYLCECGTVRLWVGNPSSPENSQQFADWYSFLHVSFGILLFLFVQRLKPRWPIAPKLVVALASSVVWEAVENVPAVIAAFGKPADAAVYFGDSILNALADTLFVLAGFLASATVPWGVALGIALLIEVVLGLAIHDGIVVGALRMLGLAS